MSLKAKLRRWLPWHHDRMRLAFLGGLFALLIATQLADTKACSSRTSPGAPTTPVSGASSTDEIFTTQDGVRFRVEVLVSNLEIPWSMAFAPDGRMFVTERPGRVRIFDAAFRVSQLALTLDDVFARGEAGTLGLALDPAFPQNHFLYLYYTALRGGAGINRLVRYREAGGRLAERAILLDDIPAGTIHDGGRIHFGPDGLLYVSAGDASNQQLAQDLGSLGGKLLRLTSSGAAPAGNPFGSPIYSYGHRNPQGFDWNPQTGDLWASEHGNIGNDETNVIDAGSNYGWPVIEDGQLRSGMNGPVTFYNPAIAPSGASFYRGQRFPQFADDFFVATLRGMHLLRLKLDASSRRVISQERLLDQKFGRLRDVISGPDGLLYFCTNNRDGRGSPISGDDRIARLIPAS